MMEPAPAAQEEPRVPFYRKVLAQARVRVLGFLRTAGDAVRDRARRLVGRARTLTPRQVFAAVFVILVLLYLFVLLVEPTGAGRGGR